MAMAIGRRALAALAAGALTFALLSGGAAALHQTLVASPLAAAMRVAGVRGYSLVQTGAAGGPVVVVRLRDGVDLEVLCETLRSRLTPILGTTPTLVVRGPGQSALVGALEAVALPVAQGVATGQFVPMARAVAALARARGLTARVEVDAAAVYVTLTPASGRGGAAYALFTRAKGVAVAGGGGG
jgi:hypothetical protein